MTGVCPGGVTETPAPTLGGVAAAVPTGPNAPVRRGYGITIPFDDLPLRDHRARLEECADLGYTDLWSSEANGADAFTPLAMAAAWLGDRHPALRYGTAIVPAFTRGPALLAQSVAALVEALPPASNLAFGIGASSDVIVERWNGIPFDEPYKRTRDMVRFLRGALTGEKVDQHFDTMTSSGFRLGRKPSVAAAQANPPAILVAALRSGMLRLARREADGAIVNWLSAEDVKRVAPEVGDGKEVVARIFVCPSDDAGAVRGFGRMVMAAYLNVPVYAAFHQWLGRGEQLQPMWDAWEAGDRKSATAAIPDGVVDDLIVHGPPERCREHVQRYVDNGVTTPVLAVLPFGVDVMDAVRALAPAASAT
jgi:probable F420-dependent oxidoreductase